MFKFVSSLVGGSAPAFPYTYGEPFRSGSGWGTWVHHRGTKTEDGSPVSIFKLEGASPADPRLSAAKNGLRRLRTTRHPNVLTFLHGVETDGPAGPGTAVVVVTESVTPLAEALESLAPSFADGKQRDEYLSWGLLQITRAVAFLTTDCRLVHGNVCAGAVTVTDSLDWRLGSLDLVTELDSLGNAESPLAAHHGLIGAQYKPAEVAKADWAAVRGGPAWAVDSWGLGCLISESFSGRQLTTTAQLRDTGRIPAALLPEYQRLLAAAPGRRLEPARLLESAALSSKLADCALFVENLALKDSAEKAHFYKRLPGLLPSLPSPFSARKLLPLTASALEVGSVPPAALAAFLAMAATLPPAEYASRAAPCLVKLFSSADRAVRVLLLQRLSEFVAHLPASSLDEAVFGALAAGCDDPQAYVREVALKALLAAAPRLPARRLNADALKLLAKLQVDDEAAIRANTTICLGNLAPHLAPATRQRVLLNAFGRALRDPFPPARVAGLMALVATRDAYDATEAASRALPAAAPLLSDADSAVRRQAFITVDALVSSLRSRSERIDAGGGEADPAAEGVRCASAVGGEGSLLAWAMSSLSFGALGGVGTSPVVAGAMGGGASGVGGGVNGGMNGGGSGASSLVSTPVKPLPPARVGGGQAAPDSDSGWDVDDGDDDDATRAESAARSKLMGGSGGVQSRGHTGGGHTGGRGGEGRGNAWGSGGADGWGDGDGGGPSPQAQTQAVSQSMTPSMTQSGARPAGGHVRPPSAGGGMRLGATRAGGGAGGGLGARKVGAGAAALGLGDDDLAKLLNG